MSEQTKKEDNIIENWFKSPDYSPVSYPYNSITDIRIKDKNVVAFYGTRAYTMQFADKFVEKRSFYVPVGVINAIPDDMHIIFKNIENAEYKSEIIFYGDTFVNKDNMIDSEYEIFTEKTLNKLSSISDKFANISLSVQFNSYKDMLFIIQTLYDMLSLKDENASVTLYATSCLPSKKDGNFFVTIADAIANEEIPSYISKEIKFPLFLDFSKLDVFDTHRAEEFGDDYTRYTSFED